SDGLGIAVVQSSAIPFDLAEVLSRPKADTFMQMMHRRGLRWHQFVIGGRRELGLKLPLELDLRPRWAVTLAKSSNCIRVAKVKWDRVDSRNAEDFLGWVKDQLSAASARGLVLVLDLSGLSYISSAGLRALIVARRESGLDTPLVLTAPSSPALEQFTL